MRLTGEIGKIVQDGKQVGGIRGWTVFVQTKPPIYSYVVAAGYWMTEKIASKVVTVEFYSQENGAMNLVCDKEGTLELPEEYVLDKLILETLKITFKDNFDWRKI